MTPSTDQSPQTRASELYTQLINCWNSRDATGFAALFAEDGETVGFDGSQMVGREEMAASLRHIFMVASPGFYVGLVRSVRILTPEVVLLRAAAGMIPADRSELDPALNAIQVLVAIHGEHGWRIASFQNTPAQFHGRPDLADALTAELRAQMRGGVTP